MNEPKLPELPEPLIQHRATFATITGYTADQMIAAMAQAAREERQRCAEVCLARLPALGVAQNKLDSDEYGARCCVEGRKQQAKADAAAILAQQEPGVTE